jgi:hypothetical protein
VREDGAGEKRLAAYVTRRGSDPEAGALRDHLKAVLPDYMVPGAFVALESLPLTPSGKLDRRALPAPELDAYVSRAYEAPLGKVEEILSGIWQDLLGVERAGRNDNFFELGGHSLLATQMLMRVRSSFSVETSMRILFEFPTLKQLGAQVDSLVQRNLLHALAGGGQELEELLERVASMPESAVEKLMRDIKFGAKA